MYSSACVISEVNHPIIRVRDRRRGCTRCGLCLWIVRRFSPRRCDHRFGRKFPNWAQSVKSECGSVCASEGLTSVPRKKRKNRNIPRSLPASGTNLFLTITRVANLNDDADDDQVLIQLLPHSTSVNYYLVAIAESVRVTARRLFAYSQ